MIFRKALLINDFDANHYKADLLIQKYRTGKLSEAEFGFSMRLWGNFEQSYDPKKYLLDNAASFKLYKTWFNEGKLTKHEYACIYRYYFNGLNMILTQKKWEELLDMVGCDFTYHQLQGKDWYRYYYIYSCHFTQ